MASMSHRHPSRPLCIVKMSFAVLSDVPAKPIPTDGWWQSATGLVESWTPSQGETDGPV